MLGCHAAPAPAPAVEPLPPLPRQIKDARYLPVRTIAAAYTLDAGALSIDGRSIPLAGTGPLDAIALAFARVPPELRALITSIAISPTPSANDALFREKYHMPVLAGMSARSSGDITIYPHGLDELRDPDVFVRNFMHELGHVWSRRAWQADRSALRAWLAAIASDPGVPSQYAQISFRNSGAPDEDAADATALYFLTRGTPMFERYRAQMPARFALIAARFGG